MPWPNSTQARQYNYATNPPNVLALLGVIARRQGEPAAALGLVEELLAHTPENYAALDTQALALTGLGDIEAARAAYRAARAINREPGVLQRAVRRLQQLADAPKFWQEQAPEC